MTNHNRILVALSFTEGRDAPFERALALARASGAELYLLHAVPANHRFSFRAAERLRRSAELRARAEAAGVTAQTFEQHGDPAEIIVLHANARPVDLIVMGTARHTGWARLRRPSVAERVLRRTKLPILVVPSDDTGEGSVLESVLGAVDLSPASTGLVDTARELFEGDAGQPTASAQTNDAEASGVSRTTRPIQGELIVSKRPVDIVPVDGSQETERTVLYAVNIARERDADVHAVQAVPRNGTLWLAPEDETGLRARLRALRLAAEREGVLVRIVTLRGTPEHVIPAYAQLNAASLIVIGHRYGSSRLWRNSAVATRLSRSSPVPVLVVPARRDVAVEASPKRIVAAVDFTVASALALRAAVDLSRRHGARLTIVHATEAPRHMVLSGGAAWRLVQRLPAEAKVLAERLKRKAVALGSQDFEPMVVTGDAHRGIVDVAKETAADLIVMGVAPRTWVDEVVSGSTLRAVMRRAKAPILVLPIIAGAHDWIDESDSGDTNVPATDAAIMRIAA